MATAAPIPSEQALTALRSMHTRDAIGVLRQFAELELYETWAVDDVLSALDEVEAELFPQSETRVTVLDERGVGPASYVGVA